MSILDAETTDVPWAETPLSLDAQQDYPPQSEEQRAIEALRILVGIERNSQRECWPDSQTKLEDYVPVLAEESGEAVKAVNDYRTNKGEVREVIHESVQTMAVIQKWLTQCPELRAALFEALRASE